MNSNRYIFGEWAPRGAGPLSADDARAICRTAAQRREEIANHPLDETMRLLDHLRGKWADPQYAPRLRMQAELPALTGFSPEMIRLGLDEMHSLLDPSELMKKVDAEFQGIPRGAGFKYEEETGRALKWHPIGTVLHVLSGNVFLVGPSSLLEGLMTGNVTILKMSSAETVFMPAFVESLLEAEAELGCAPVVSRSLAVIDYASSQKDVIDAFKREVDGIVVWGGEAAVAAYRNDLPARTRLVVFGPKLSIGVVTKDGLAEQGVESCAERIALELAVWDQNACTAPQMCYVESEELAKQLVEALPSALNAMQARIPAGPMDPNQAAEIRKLRSIYEVAEIRGDGILRASPAKLDWTVILGKDLEIEPSPLHRTLRIVPFNDLADVKARINGMRAYIQTVGLYTSEARHFELATELGNAGVLRVMELGQMTGGAVDDPHDGAYDLPQLMNLVVSRRKLPAGRTAYDLCSPSERTELLSAKLRSMVDAARKNPFYAKRLEGIRVTGLADLAKLPVLSRADLYELLAPGKREQEKPLTGGGYVTRSGGTTGEPAYSYFDGGDWEALVDNAVGVFKACGLDKGDRLANCMMAGDLYGSFVSFNHVNQRLGLTSFAFAGKTDAEGFANIWRLFKLNAIQGMPSSIVPLLRQVKEVEAAFTLDKVMYAGQPMNPNDRAWLQEALGAKLITSVIGTTEAGQIGYQCPHCEGRVHHLVDDYNYIEVVDEQGAPVPDGTVGRILVTTLAKAGGPLLRYAIGDGGRILPASEAPCACGRATRRIEYLGRCDDIMAIGLMNIRYSDFEKALEGLPVNALQIVGRQTEASDVIHLNVESDAAGAELEGKVRSQVLARVGEVEEMMHAGHVELTVNVVRPGVLERNARTGKLKLLIDERYK